MKRTPTTVPVAVRYIREAIQSSGPSGLSTNDIRILTGYAQTSISYWLQSKHLAPDVMRYWKQPASGHGCYRYRLKVFVS